jgi:hypothetical protein
MELIPIVELGVSEAFEILTGRFGVTDLPPLDSLENEDWGRDYLLSRFLELSRSALAESGLCLVETKSERAIGDELRASLAVPGLLEGSGS